MAKKTKIHKMLIALLKQSRKKEKRKQCVDTIQQIRRTDQISDDILMEITPIPQTQRNDVWNKYQNKVIKAIEKINKQMHTRARTKWREQMKYFKYRREEQRKSQGELKNILTTHYKDQPQKINHLQCSNKLKKVQK